ncbi:MAG: bifunctional diguanylate cyclase/phosphodiesterase [Pseudomonadota bacterium]
MFGVTEFMSAEPTEKATTVSVLPGLVEDPEVPTSAVIESHDHEVAYCWDMRSDKMVWQAHAATILGLEPDRLPGTGEDYHTLIVDEHVQRRSAVTALSAENDLGSGVSYRITYRIAPHGPRSRDLVWVEDCGRWWAGEDGRPIQARGFIRIGEGISQLAITQAAADYDELTGQLTRLRLADALNAVMRRVGFDRFGEPGASFLMVSVNNLQRVNDTFGYDTGDQVIAEVGRRLRNSIRAGDTLGRYSANKFGIILAECSAEEVQQTAERLVATVAEKPVTTDGCKIAATVSVGAVLLPEQAETTDMCFGRVLRALDDARLRSRTSYAVYQPDEARDLRRTRTTQIAEFIDSAIEERRLDLQLQPIVWTKTRKPALYECLLRVDETVDGGYAPGDFIPIAEELGLASMIDKRTLQVATEMLRDHSWLDLSLNVSALTCTDHLWLADLGKRVRETPDIAPRLVIEITETMAATDIDEAAYFVDAVRDLGCRVAIDDFGAGYTSFANLKRIKADILKIDGSFVHNVLREKTDQVFVRTMVEIAQSFDMETVAEWVNDDETADFVEQLDVTYIQGFHFGVPVPIRSVIESRQRELSA